MTEEDALKDIYNVDIMRDNVDLCKKRLGNKQYLYEQHTRPIYKIR